MKNAVKSTLKLTAAAAATAAGAFGTCCFIDELLFNRKLKLPAAGTLLNEKDILYII